MIGLREPRGKMEQGPGKTKTEPGAIESGPVVVGRTKAVLGRIVANQSDFSKKKRKGRGVSRFDSRYTSSKVEHVALDRNKADAVRSMIEAPT